MKEEGTVDRSSVTRWLKEFCSSCKNVNSQARSGRPKIDLDILNIKKQIQKNH